MRKGIVIFMIIVCAGCKDKLKYYYIGYVADYKNHTFQGSYSVNCRQIPPLDSLEQFAHNYIICNTSCNIPIDNITIVGFYKFENKKECDDFYEGHKSNAFYCKP